MRRYLLYLLITGITIAIFGVIFLFFRKDGGVIDNLPRLGTNPFGNPEDVGGVKPPDTRGGSNIPIGVEGEPSSVPLLEKVWDKPVAGFSFADLTILISTSTINQKGEPVIVQIKATSSVIYFVEKATGNVYKRDLDKRTVTRITNTTIPQVYDAYFIRDGTYVAMRTYDSKTKKIKTFIASVPQIIAESDPLALGDVKFLQDDVISISPSYDGLKLYYLVPNQSGSSLYEWTKEKGALLISSYPLKELLLSVNSKGVYVNTKASAYVPGYLFSSNFSNIYGGKTGMTTNTSPKGDLVLVSMWSNTGLVTFIRNINNGEEKSLSIRSLSEKCVWSTAPEELIICGEPSSIPITQSGFPDDWYQGLITFDDDIVVVDAKNGLNYKIINPTNEVGTQIDLFSPRIKKDLEYAGFLDNKTKDFWLIHLRRALVPTGLI